MSDNKLAEELIELIAGLTAKYAIDAAKAAASINSEPDMTFIVSEVKKKSMDDVVALLTRGNEGASIFSPLMGLFCINSILYVLYTLLEQF